MEAADSGARICTQLVPQLQVSSTQTVALRSVGCSGGGSGRKRREEEDEEEEGHSDRVGVCMVQVSRQQEVWQGLSRSQARMRGHTQQSLECVEKIYNRPAVQKSFVCSIGMFKRKKIQTSKVQVPESSIEFSRVEFNPVLLFLLH